AVSIAMHLSIFLALSLMTPERSAKPVASIYAHAHFYSKSMRVLGQAEPKGIVVKKDGSLATAKPIEKIVSAEKPRAIKVKPKDHRARALKSGAPIGTAAPIAAPATTATAEVDGQGEVALAKDMGERGLGGSVVGRAKPELLNQDQVRVGYPAR